MASNVDPNVILANQNVSKAGLKAQLVTIKSEIEALQAGGGSTQGPVVFSMRKEGAALDGDNTDDTAVFNSICAKITALVNAVGYVWLYANRSFIIDIDGSCRLDPSQMVWPEQTLTGEPYSKKRVPVLLRIGGEIYLKNTLVIDGSCQTEGYGPVSTNNPQFQSRISGAFWPSLSWNGHANDPVVRVMDMGRCEAIAFHGNDQPAVQIGFTPHSFGTHVIRSIAAGSGGKVRCYSPKHRLTTSDSVYIADDNANVANGIYTVTVVDADYFDLNGTTFTSASTKISWTQANRIITATTSGTNGDLRCTCVGHNLGRPGHTSPIFIWGMTGVGGAETHWNVVQSHGFSVRVIDANTFDIIGLSAAGKGQTGYFWTNSATAEVWLKDCGWANSSTSYFDACVIENMFWVYIDNCAAMGGENHYAIGLGASWDVGPNVNTGVGLIWIRDGVWASKGLNLFDNNTYATPTGGAIYVEDILMENPTSAFVTINGRWNVMNMEIKRCGMADKPLTYTGTIGMIENNSPNTNNVLIEGCDHGPADQPPVFGLYPVKYLKVRNPQVSFHYTGNEYKLFDVPSVKQINEYDSELAFVPAYRGGMGLESCGIPANAYVFDIPSDISTWSGDGNTTVTSGQVAPDGSLTAYKIHWSGYAGRSLIFYNTDPGLIFTNDIVVAGMMVRAADQTNSLTKLANIFTIGAESGTTPNYWHSQASPGTPVSYPQLGTNNIKLMSNNAGWVSYGMVGQWKGATVVDVRPGIGGDAGQCDLIVWRPFVIVLRASNGYTIEDGNRLLANLSFYDTSLKPGTVGFVQPIRPPVRTSTLDSATTVGEGATVYKSGRGLVSATSSGTWIDGSGLPVFSAPKFNTTFLSGVGTVKVAAGFRRMLPAYTTQKLIRVRRSVDDTELDIGYNLANYLDVKTLLEFAAGGDAFVVKLYDQSGNGFDFVNATNAEQWYIVKNGELCGNAYGPLMMGRTGGGAYVANIGTAYASNTVWAVTVGSMSTSGRFYERFISGIQNGLLDYAYNQCFGLARKAVNNEIGIERGGTSGIASVASLTPGQLYVVGALFDGTNATTQVGSSAGTPAASAANFNIDRIILGASAPGVVNEGPNTDSFRGEAIVFTGTLPDSTARSTVLANIRAATGCL